MNNSSDYFHIKISLEFLVKSLIDNVFSLITLEKKSSELSNCYDYFLRLSGFPDFLG